MGDKGGKKDKSKKEKQTAAQHTLKEKRKLKKEKQIQGAFTTRTKEQVCSLRSSEALALQTSNRDASAPFREYITFTLGDGATSPLLDLFTPGGTGH